MSRPSDNRICEIETTLSILHVLLRDVSAIRESGIIRTALLGYDAKGRHRTGLPDCSLGRTVLDGHTAGQRLERPQHILVDRLLCFAGGSCAE